MTRPAACVARFAIAISLLCVGLVGAAPPSKPAEPPARPYAYLLPPGAAAVSDDLQRRGVTVEELREDIELDVEVDRIDEVRRAVVTPPAPAKPIPVAVKPGTGKVAVPAAKPEPAKPAPTAVPSAPAPAGRAALELLRTTRRKEPRRIAAGTYVVRHAASPDKLAALLEPQAKDSLAASGAFDADLVAGKDFGVLRLPVEQPLLLTAARLPVEKRPAPKPITYDDYRNGKTPNLWGAPTAITGWLDDGEHYIQPRDHRLWKVHARNGRSAPLYDPAPLAAALAKLPGIDAGRANGMAQPGHLPMNPQRTGVLVNHENDLYYCSLDGATSVRLTRTPAAEELATFSPDGRYVAFVRQQNLYAVDIATQTERALSTEGGGEITCGKADWVYYEEVYMRRWQAYWWSPDSTRVAYLRFDDAPVYKFTVLDTIPTRQHVETTAYPKTGDPNPRVRLGIATVAGGATRWADAGAYSEDASLVMRVVWSLDSQRVLYYMMDRAQTWLDLCAAPRDGGPPRVLFRETTKAWVDDPGDPALLKDGSLIWSSERNGWKHLYHYAADGKLIRQLTDGPWEARSVAGVDEANGWVYFTGTKDSHVAVNFYRVRLDGSRIERLTQAPGTHGVRLSPKCNYYVDSYSSYASPPKASLHQADGTLLRTLDSNPVYALEGCQLARTEPAQIRTPDGFLLEATVLKPVDFDPKRKYPVWMKIYGGPSMPSIVDAWHGGRIEDQAMTQLGFIIVQCDPRSASGKGACSAWTAYKRLGVQETADLESAADWLVAQGYVDPARIGLSGYSYGGYLTSFVLTHSKKYAAGIAGCAVTDWRNYDSIYTERYMRLPQENPKGYDESSVVKAAANLHGRLLLIHGLMDDNVHAQNATQLIEALQQANRDFTLMVYPRARHGFGGRHFQDLCLGFMREHLLGAKPAK